MSNLDIDVCIERNSLLNESINTGILVKASILVIWLASMSFQFAEYMKLGARTSVSKSFTYYVLAINFVVLLYGMDTRYTALRKNITLIIYATELVFVVVHAGLLAYVCSTSGLLRKIAYCLYFVMTVALAVIYSRQYISILALFSNGLHGKKLFDSTSVAATDREIEQWLIAKEKDLTLIRMKFKFVLVGIIISVVLVLIIVFGFTASMENDQSFFAFQIFSFLHSFFWPLMLICKFNTEMKRYKSLLRMYDHIEISFLRWVPTIGTLLGVVSSIVVSIIKALVVT